MLELFIAFGAGLISFLSPCVLPLIPGYISYISGASLDELLANKKINLVPLILFTLGFSFVFIMKRIPIQDFSLLIQMEMVQFKLMHRKQQQQQQVL